MKDKGIRCVTLKKGSILTKPKSITDNVDTSTPSGRFFFHIMASLAQMERELVAERTRAGLAAAKAQGRLGGRKRKMAKSKVKSTKKLLASGIGRVS